MGFGLATGHVLVGKPERARYNLERILKQDPDNAAVRERLEALA